MSATTAPFTLTETEIIAISVASGVVGLVLIVLLVTLCICCCIRRNRSTHTKTTIYKDGHNGPPPVYGNGGQTMIYNNDMPPGPGMALPPRRLPRNYSDERMDERYREDGREPSSSFSSYSYENGDQRGRGERGNGAYDYPPPPGPDNGPSYGPAGYNGAYDYPPPTGPPQQQQQQPMGHPSSEIMWDVNRMEWSDAFNFNLALPRAHKDRNLEWMYRQ